MYVNVYSCGYVHSYKAAITEKNSSILFSICVCGSLPFSSYQLSTAGALLQYIAAASEAECIAHTMGNISQYLMCVCEIETRELKDRQRETNIK